MKKYLTRDRIIFIAVICLLVLGLTSCDTTGNMYTKGLNNFSDETNLYGWLLIWPMAWLMHTIGSIFPYGYGQFAWGIIFTTIIVRTIAWPIYAKTGDVSIKMQVAQPEINKIQEKYANRKDPESQQRMQQETMAVYKKYKINFFGCLAPLVQMPLFMAMYTVVRRITVPTITIVENGIETEAIAKLALTDASFLGIKDCLKMGVTDGAELWSGGFWMGIVLAVLVGASMWFLNYLAQKKPAYQKNTASHQNKNPQGDQMQQSMKLMNYFMIAMMVFVSLSNNGLALYWVIGNLYSVVQNLINRKQNEKKYYKMKNSNTIDALIK